MIRFLCIAMEVLPAAIILVPVIVTFQLAFWKTGSLQRKIGMVLFGVYLAAVFSVVGLPDVKYIRLEPNFNLLPIVDIVNAPLGYLKNTVLNILLFLPLGFLLPVIWEEFQSFKRTAVFGFCLSLGIELSQIFTYRLTDVDDLITNTLGTAAGFYLAKMYLKKAKTDTALGGRFVELAVIMGSALLVMFFVQPYICAWLWDMVL